MRQFSFYLVFRDIVEVGYIGDFLEKGFKCVFRIFENGYQVLIVERGNFVNVKFVEKVGCV